MKPEKKKRTDELSKGMKKEEGGKGETKRRQWPAGLLGVCMSPGLP